MSRYLISEVNENIQAVIPYCTCFHKNNDCNKCVIDKSKDFQPDMRYENSSQIPNILIGGITMEKLN